MAGKKRTPSRRKSSARRKPAGPRKSARKKPSTKTSVKRKTSTASRKRTVRTASTRRRRSRRNGLAAWMPAFSRFVTKVAVLGLVGLVGLGAVIFWYGRGLPPVDNLAALRHQPKITILDRTGTVMGIHGQDRGDPVSADSLPPHVIDAFLATEDRNFFHHVGVNPIAILRALTVNLKSGEVEQGGSTITQQLVKNLLLTPEQTLERKVQEMLLALQIERRYNKDEILSLYLNAVYFGNGAYGIEAAARRYFGKTPRELTVGEAAMLAGLLKAPSRFSPTNSEVAAKTRAKVVLDAMVDAGYITRTQGDTIVSAGIAHIVEEDRRAGYAIDHAVAEAQGLLGKLDHDIVVQTTFDLSAINMAADARASIAAADPLYTAKVQTAALALEEDGAIRVLIGGNDYGTSVYNRATQARRQPGSVFKPFVYLAAMEEGWRPEDMIDDSPIRIGNYQPQNYLDRYYGPVPLTEALSRSLNAAAIRLQEQVGRQHVINVARRAGLSQVSDTGPAVALGVMDASPLEIAESFLPLSNGGYPVKSYTVLRVATPEGEVLYNRRLPAQPRPVFSAESLIAFDHMMRAVVRSGSGRRAQVPGHYVAGKTGTSNDSRDAWFAGYASGMVGVVWLGKDDDTPMDNGRGYISGSGAPAKLFSAMMTAALGDRPARQPIPYTPRPKPKTLFEHLADILGGGRNEPSAAERGDDLSQLLDEVITYE